MIRPLVLLATLVLTGCGATGTGTPTPQSTTNTTSEIASAGEAPPVTGTELSLEKYKAEPCSLLKPEQIARLGDMKPGMKRDRSGQPQCIWYPKASTGAFSYTFTLSKSTLDDFYQKAKPQFPTFRATEVAGYPGASYDGRDAASGDCTTVVALSNQADVLMVQVNNSTATAQNYETPCAVSEQGAAIAIEGLR